MLRRSRPLVQRTSEVEQISVSGLTLGISMRDFRPWQEWHEQYVLNGRHEQSEVDATIEVLAADLSQTLVRVDLEGVSPLRLEMGGSEANKEGLARFEIELSVEGIHLDLTP